jgi:hypothetical protein
VSIEHKALVHKDKLELGKEIDRKAGFFHIFVE